jgi:predicted RNase H-like HicB family nuclease
MRELSAQIHEEDGSYWAEVSELPGCFASGDSIPELIEALQEAVALYLAPQPSQPVATHVSGVRMVVPDRASQPA